MVSDILGILGFLLAVFTFILTRRERRRSLSISLYASEKEWPEWIDQDHNFVIAKIVNDSEKRVHLNPDTAEFYLNRKKVDKYCMDIVFGLKEIPYPLNPGQSVEIGVTADNYLTCAGYEDFGEFTVDVDFTIEDVKGKKFKNKNKYEYLAMVGKINMKN